MTKRTSIAVLRLLLVVLFSTFMSPSFAWQMIDSHNELPDTDSIVGIHHHDDDLYHHHHHHDADGDEEDDIAHGQIGHLLSHLPVVMQDITVLPASKTVAIAFSLPPQSVTFITVDPPYKPPRHFLFV